MGELYATAALGTEDLVGRELRALGFRGVEYGPGGARFAAPDGEELLAAMRACLHLRVALRVLWPLARFPAADADALYRGAADVPWERHLTPGSPFAIGATTGAPPPLAHAPFLGQRVKDAVVDRLRARLGARPDVSRDDPDVRLYVHVAPPRRGRDGPPVATVGLDVAGDSLHARGYRVASTPAPLRETLAAAVLAAAGWTAGVPLLDPTCGSGTLVIEAALLACRIAPGRAGSTERAFGFLRWPAVGAAERAAWRRLVDEADAQARPRAPVALVGGDRDEEALAAARRNAAAAGEAVAASIEWRVADARDATPLDPPGVVVANPPYGERLGEAASPGMTAFWRTLGARLRTLDGHTAFLLVPSSDAARALAMRPTWQRRLKNGPLDVTLCRFELGRRRPRR